MPRRIDVPLDVSHIDTYVFGDLVSVVVLRVYLCGRVCACELVTCAWGYKNSTTTGYHSDFNKVSDYCLGINLGILN